MSWWVTTYGGVTVKGSSMCQTLQSEDNLLIRYTKSGAVAERGDIIVVYVGDYEECKSVADGYLIKRLIAVEGDKVKCENEQLYICYAGTDTWVELDEPYAYYGNTSSVYDFGGMVYTVGEDEIFFLGDNRENSCDSRYAQTGGSHLTNQLYKEKDIFGVVPEWALKRKDFFEKLFTVQRKLENFKSKIKNIFQ